MKDRIGEINNHLLRGNLHTARTICLRQIKEYGEENCQLEIYYLATVYFSLKDYLKAKYWIERTKADPENSLILKEKIDEKLCF